MNQVFKIALMNFYPQDVRAVRAREIKVEDVDHAKLEVNGEDLAVDVNDSEEIESEEEDDEVNMNDVQRAQPNAG